MQSAYAGFAKLSVKINGPIHDNSYFVCLYGLGCYSVLAGAQGKLFPITSTHMANLKRIAVTNVRNRRLYFQPITESCNVTLKDNQTITINGRLEDVNARLRISDLTCSVS